MLLRLRLALRRPAFAFWGARSCSSCSAPRPFPTTLDSTAAAAAPPKPPADHRELAQQQNLFTTSLYSPGSPLLLPNGSAIFNKLANFLRAQYPLFGFREVITPTIYKKSLWEKSGHWENYASDMFSVQGRDKSKAEVESMTPEEFGLKPMNCPGHCLLFASEKRSYRDLPVRYADFSALHRNEGSGALSGLTRVRRFHQDDGHIFCRPSQIQAEIRRTLDFVAMVYGTFGLGPYKLMLSTRPEEHYIGTAEEWARAEGQLKAALDQSGREWAINEGDGAFYGPKIDIILKDSDGKEHQTATIQLDFQLPQRFELGYTAPAPELEQRGEETTDPALLAHSGLVTPVIIHRAILGSLERFLALLIEHYDGHYPFWLAPRQAIILSLSDNPTLTQHCHRLAAYLSGAQPTRDPETGTLRPAPMGRPAVQVDLDLSPRHLNKKIREAKQKGYNHILVVGDKEMNAAAADGGADAWGTANLTFWSQPNMDASRRVLEVARGTLAQSTEAAGDKTASSSSSVKANVRDLKRYFEGLLDAYL
ncbi:uncharacterized protein K452DRAFT_289327 [Aplosporella prunicola CBS 121167]|uniref:threonine--tRNA ligase n=1 Tax=Aplosporella prunicola CBS 121167 TaxID=1176127 RepID=A0A6A6B753_9PEZI|nr:uncharacterized protein K452DRAFT_289327 [Aplosporella prunicola CBS 121167]KAF2139949.1 hypothetical protein K452DRAFT_289327 [Aplosporella prunicola CBS 121167]